MVLTFDFAFGKPQREHPHKLSDHIVKERCIPGTVILIARTGAERHQTIRITAPKFNQTHKYTGEQGSNDSLGMPAYLDFRGLAQGTPALKRAAHYSGQVPPVNT